MGALGREMKGETERGICERRGWGSVSPLGVGGERRAWGRGCLRPEYMFTLRDWTKWVEN